MRSSRPSRTSSAADFVLTGRPCARRFASALANAARMLSTSAMSSVGVIWRVSTASVRVLPVFPVLPVPVLHREPLELLVGNDRRDRTATAQDERVAAVLANAVDLRSERRSKRRQRKHARTTSLSRLARLSRNALPCRNRSLDLLRRHAVTPVQQ